MSEAPVFKKRKRRAPTRVRSIAGILVYFLYIHAFIYIYLNFLHEQKKKKRPATKMCRRRLMRPTLVCSRRRANRHVAVAVGKSDFFYLLFVSLEAALIGLLFE